MESASSPRAHTATPTSTTARRRRTSSSRIDSQLLGILLFIISEAMLFGSFFTAYFFIRVVQNEPWPPDPFEFPVLVASMNTAILVSSSFTVHYALHSIKKGNRLGTAGRPGGDLPARGRCSC